MSRPDRELRALRDEIVRLLDAALDSNVARAEEIADTQRDRAQELGDAQREHDAQVHNLELALEHRDIIGQAKGVIMVTVHCDADAAFELLRKQSQHENRKLLDVAAEIAERAARRR